MKKTMKKRKINKIKKHQKHTRKHKKTIKQKRYYKNRKYSKKFKGGKICLEKDPTQCLVEVSKIDKKSSSGTGIILRSLSPITVTPSGLSLPIIPPPSGFKLPPPPAPSGSPNTIDLTKTPRITDEQIELFGELVKNGETDDVIREKMIISGLNEDDVNYLLNSNSNESTPTGSPSVSTKLVTTGIPPPPPPPRPSVTTIGKGIPPPPPPPPPAVSNNLQPTSFLQQLNNPEIQKTLKKQVVDVNIEKQKGKEKLTLFEKRFQGKDTTTENPKIYPTDISDDDENNDDSDSSDDTKKGSYLKIDTFVNPELTQKMVDNYNKKNSIQNKKEIEKIPKKTAVSLGNVGKNENVIKMVEAVQAKDQSSDDGNDNDDWDTDSQDGGKTGHRRSRKMKNVRKKKTNTRKKIRK